MEWNWGDLNYIAIVVAIVVGQVFGGLLFSPVLLGNAWMKAIGTTKEEIMARPGPKAVPFVIAIGAGVIVALIIAHILQQLSDPGIGEGLLVGGALAAVFAGMDATHKSFAGNNLKHFLIDNIHTVITFLIFGAIIGVWE
ncbi:MAG: DUF1761 domain-containing protein [Chloroflexi bacterium]|nr:DUF1761 domain-containing protein [Chloroflexota bacterium]